MIKADRTSEEVSGYTPRVSSQGAHGRKGHKRHGPKQNGHERNSHERNGIDGCTSDLVARLLLVSSGSQDSQRQGSQREDSECQNLERQDAPLSESQFQAVDAPVTAVSDVPHTQKISQLADLLVSDDGLMSRSLSASPLMVDLESQVEDIINEAGARSYDLRALYSDVAQELGLRWERDTASFVDVSIATSRLQSLLKRRSEGVPVTKSFPACSVLLGTLDGDQHTLGLSLVAEEFRRSGWSTVFAGGYAFSDLEKTLAGGHFHAVALSASSRVQSLRHAKSQISSLRKKSSTPVCILAGGKGIIELQTTAGELGVDAILDEPKAATCTAATFVAYTLRQ